MQGFTAPDAWKLGVASARNFFSSLVGLLCFPQLMYKKTESQFTDSRPSHMSSPQTQVTVACILASSQSVTRIIVPFIFLTCSLMLSCRE